MKYLNNYHKNDLTKSKNEYHHEDHPRAEKQNQNEVSVHLPVMLVIVENKSYVSSWKSELKPSSMSQLGLTVFSLYDLIFIPLNLFPSNFHNFPLGIIKVS